MSSKFLLLRARLHYYEEGSIGDCGWKDQGRARRTFSSKTRLESETDGDEPQKDPEPTDAQHGKEKVLDLFFGAQISTRTRFKVSYKTSQMIPFNTCNIITTAKDGTVRDFSSLREKSTALEERLLTSLATI